MSKQADPACWRQAWPRRPGRPLLAVGLSLVVAAAPFWPAAVASPAAPPPARQLDLRQLDLRFEEGELAGRFVYALVVGTFFEWNTDPTAIPGLFGEIRRRTRLRPRVDFNAVGMSSAELFTNPFLIMTGNRLFRLAEEEIDNLRAYLLAGGAIYADDCGGADYSFRHLLRQVLPKHELQEVPADHPIFTSHYSLAGVPKILDLYGTEAKGLGIFIDGRLAIFYTYDTDIPCGWEKNPDGSFVHILGSGKHEQAIRLGVNVVTYFLTQLQARQAAGASGEVADER